MWFYQYSWASIFLDSWIVKNKFQGYVNFTYTLCSKKLYFIKHFILQRNPGKLVFRECNETMIFTCMGFNISNYGCNLPSLYMYVYQ